ncbi:uncharacterized protein LOC123319778 [Coccinella septempunctata]|uniref:uncharacterized protein LOC123319778 n=1 Tax=Coccinella septempunctata TaxID=41139 RepID=UPI001D07FD07|nr:uncharacterized protein LOC123319778 [Coccinella septempunctata]
MFFHVLKLLAVAALCVSSVRSEEDKKMCPFLAACLKETDGKVKIEDMKVLMTAKIDDVDGISEDVLCVSKCALEKKQLLVDDKFDVDKLLVDKMMVDKVEKKEDFVECVKKIEAVKECGDLKEFMKCKIRFTKD